MTNSYAFVSHKYRFLMCTTENCKLRKGLRVIICQVTDEIITGIRSDEHHVNRNAINKILGVCALF